MKENKNPNRWKGILTIAAAVALLIVVSAGAVVLLNSGFRFSAAESGTEPSEIIQEPSSFETLPTTPIEPNTDPTMDTQPVETTPAETKPRDEEWYQLRDIALEYVGVSIMELTELESEKDDQIGIIEFKFGTMTDDYEVEIRLSDSTVVKVETEKDPAEEIDKMYAFTRLDAMKILLEYLEADWADLMYLSIDTQLRRVPTYYKIELATDKLAGTYIISARERLILESHPIIPPDGRISQEDALNLVLLNIDARISKISDLELDLTKRDGRSVYEISFHYQGMNHEYVVTAYAPGSILSSHTETGEPGILEQVALPSDKLRQQIYDDYTRITGSPIRDSLIFTYYGEYDSAHVMYMDVGPWSNAVTSETVAGLQFIHGISIQLKVYYNGIFHSLESAYEAGILDLEDLHNVYIKHSTNNPYYK